MSKVRKETVRVIKTDKLNQRKLRKIARRYSVSPVDIRELQLGHGIDVPRKAAERMEQDGYVTRTRSKPRTAPERLNQLTTVDLTPTLTPETGDDTASVEPPVGDDTDPIEENEDQLNGDV